ncbi:MAG TPA: hypothetical protein VK778_08060 [Solirubrobacteraceae bacterium]|nr:hypothetical protein [Solirubrobacteraceae bacterium]
MLIAAVAATFSVYRVDGSGLKARSLQYSSATTQLLVDSPTSVLGDLSQSFEPLSARATVYANFMASPAVLALIGQQVGLSGGQLYATGPVSASQPRVVQEPTALKRNTEITGETDPYRLSFESQPNLPTINVYAQAPSTALAVGLANGAVVGLKQYVTALEEADKTPPRARVTIRRLGPANGAVVDGGISKELAVLVFVGVCLLWCILLLAASRFREVWRGSAMLQDWDEHAGSDAGHRGELVDGPSEVSMNGHGDSDAHPLGTPSREEDDGPVIPVRSLL